MFYLNISHEAVFIVLKPDNDKEPKKRSKLCLRQSGTWPFHNVVFHQTLFIRNVNICFLLDLVLMIRMQKIKQFKCLFALTWRMQDCLCLLKQSVTPIFINVDLSGNTSTCFFFFYRTVCFFPSASFLFFNKINVNTVI